MYDELLEEILKKYSAGNLMDFARIPTGVSSENYKVKTSKGTYFLKKHRESVLERIESLERLEQFFAANGIPIITPISTIDNKLHCLHDHACYVLYPFVSGDTFEQGKVSDEVVKNMAEMLAKIHLLTRDGIQEQYADVSVYFIPRKTEVMTKEIDTLLEHIEHLQSKVAYDELAERGLALKRAFLLQHASEIDDFSFNDRNLGHGDYHPGNIFFNNDLTISALFDLDMAGALPRIYELVRAIMLTCLNHNYSKEKIQQSKIFIKTYHDLYPFDEEDLTKGMEAFYFETLATWREKAHYWEHDGRTDGEYEDTIQSIHYLTDYRAELVDTLYTSTQE
ncbi:MAG: phosphotransferase [Bacteroidota bacterium]